MQEGQAIVDALTSSSQEVLNRWLVLQREGLKSPSSIAGMEDKVRQQSSEFLAALTTAVKNGGAGGITGPGWAPVRELLADPGSPAGSQRRHQTKRRTGGSSTTARRRPKP